MEPAAVAVKEADNLALEAAEAAARGRGETLSAEALAAYDYNVPRSLVGAIARFAKEPSVAIILAGIVATVALRVDHPWGPADALAIPVVAVFWLLQEWFLHSKLLHNESNWYGRRIHERHHLVPFYHISVDSTNVVLPTMIVAACFWHLVFKGCPGLALTATLTYYIMGLIYEWTHFLVHTRVPMRSWLARTIKRAHVRHHLRDERFWFSFTCPPIDNLFGTVPPQAVGRPQIADKGKAAVASGLKELSKHTVGCK